MSRPDTQKKKETDRLDYLFGPDTSRRPRDDELNGNTYHFTTRTEMEVDVKAGRFLEHGEYDGNLYGTKIESIHEVVATGRTCILDVNPQVGGAAGSADDSFSK